MNNNREGGYKNEDEIINELMPDTELLEEDFLPDKISIGDYVDFGIYGNLYVVDKTGDDRAWVSENTMEPGCWLMDLKLACYIIKKAALSQDQIAQINEDLAERAHELWVEREKAKGNVDNSNLIPYSELSEEDKESDRDYSIEFLDILDEEGFEINEKEDMFETSNGGSEMVDRKRNPLRNGTGDGEGNTGRGGCEHPTNPNRRVERGPRPIQRRRTPR